MIKVFLTALVAQGASLPIIDMHIHAEDPANMPDGLEVCVNTGELEFPGLDPARSISLENTMACSHAAKIAPNLEANIEAHRRYFERYNIWGMVDITTHDVLTSLEVMKQWKAGLGDRMAWVGIDFNDLQKNVEPGELEASLEQLVADGTVQLFAEIDPQYEGLKATELKFDRYFALAEKLDIPVGIHLGETIAGASHVIPEPGYSPMAGRPTDLDPLFKKYPRMRAYVMHAGVPLVDEMIYILGSHPQVYVDISGAITNTPKKQAHWILRRLVEAGYSKRIMFGSDPMVFPDFIPAAIDFVNEADYLTEQQRRDIFYYNAARFLRLSDEEIAKHHGR